MFHNSSEKDGPGNSTGPRDGPRDGPDATVPATPARAVAVDRRPRIVLQAMALASSVTALVLLVVVTESVTGPVALAVLATAVPPLLVSGALARRGLRSAPPDGAHRQAEQLHEIRATVAGIVLSHRMLRGHHADLSRGDRSRLENLHDAELERLERLLVAEPERRISAVVLDDVLAPLVSALRLRGHDVHWRGTQWCALGRPDEVAEIVHVLLENAARHAAGHAIEVIVVRRGPWLDLRVSDHGEGVAPEMLPSLFERGARGPGSPGSGIGLHVARRLSLEMKGRLRLDRPVAGTGASFVLTLPAATSMSGALPVGTKAS